MRLFVFVLAAVLLVGSSISNVHAQVWSGDNWGIATGQVGIISPDGDVVGKSETVLVDGRIDIFAWATNLDEEISVDISFDVIAYRAEERLVLNKHGKLVVETYYVVDGSGAVNVPFSMGPAKHASGNQFREWYLDLTPDSTWKVGARYTIAAVDRPMDEYGTFIVGREINPAEVPPGATIEGLR